MLKQPRSGPSKEVMEKDEQEKKNLCVNCKYKQNCNYRKQTKENIIFCEEYEIEKIPSLKSRHKKESEQSGKSNTAENKKLRFNGLCINCANRFNCTHPKPEGGVWHCEDYM